MFVNFRQMKVGVKFILTYYGLSILFLFLSGQVVLGLAGEIMSYLLWFYIYNIIIGIIVFPFALILIRKLNVMGGWKLGICFFVVLVLLNVPLLADSGHIITLEALKELFDKGLRGVSFNVMGIQLIAIVSFLIAGWMFRREFFVGLRKG